MRLFFTLKNERIQMFITVFESQVLFYEKKNKKKTYIYIYIYIYTLEIQYIAVRYFAISSISRIVRGPQIYHDHKKKKISKCFFYLI